MPDDVGNKHVVMYFLAANFMLGIERQKCESEPKDYHLRRYDFGFGFEQTSEIETTSD
jgi:hypothetical protein